MIISDPHGRSEGAKVRAAQGFSPGSDQRGVSNAYSGADAADLLLTSAAPTSEVASGEGILLLADGSRYSGTLFGADVVGEGELVFTTGMTGFQESLTDPSFAGQVLTFTWPLLGNYGVAAGISESAAVWPRGVVCREWIDHPDHRHSIGSVHDFLLAHGVPGITTVDTRSVTRRVREHGTLLCVFGPVEQETSLRSRLERMSAPDLDDLVAEVSRDQAVLLNEGALGEDGDPLPRIGALDCGIKHNILRELCKRFEVLWAPPDIGWDDLTDAWRIDALFCSNGPGDPAHSGQAKSARKTLAVALECDMPTMGICLGHQLLGLANGLETYKLRYGHRGANQPVVDLQTGKVDITSQNHGFAVCPRDEAPLAAHPNWEGEGPPTALFDSATEVRFVNANDRTVEGLDVIGKPAFTVQYHPEACPGPHDAAPLFERFEKMVENHLGGALPLNLREVT
ncbi:MAG: carbamoyl phosphate synthase small subunit [Methanobacteriota archaeon]|nr:MAG: carbamoyl phosphate synthase small subunit [Euryarchaeota archaeon]